MTSYGIMSVVYAMELLNGKDQQSYNICEDNIKKWEEFIGIDFPRKIDYRMVEISLAYSRDDQPYYNEFILLDYARQNALLIIEDLYGL